MEINLKIKIRAGGKTPMAVAVDCLAVNEKKIVFRNGNSISDRHIAHFLKVEIVRVLGHAEHPIGGY